MSARLMEIGFRPQLTLNSGSVEPKGAGGWSPHPMILYIDEAFSYQNLLLGSTHHITIYLPPPEF